MLSIRVIPTLLLKDWGIVKTVRFNKETYIGCPINAVRVFNSNNVDELILLDIQATRQGRGPDPEIVTQIADEACMPITIGGGIRDLETVRSMLNSGADKVCINTAAVEDPHFVEQAAGRFGSQCVVVSIDVKKRWRGGHEVYTRRGRQRTRLSPVEHAIHMEELGAGEILLNSVDRDGTWEGYDLELLHEVADAVNVPVIACGGAGKLQDFADAVHVGGASAVSAGSYFLYHGRRRGILITFPTRDQLQSIFGEERMRV